MRPGRRGARAALDAAPSARGHRDCGRLRAGARWQPSWSPRCSVSRSLGVALALGLLLGAGNGVHGPHACSPSARAFAATSLARLHGPQRRGRGERRVSRLRPGGARAPVGLAAAQLVLSGRFGARGAPRADERVAPRRRRARHPPRPPDLWERAECPVLLPVQLRHADLDRDRHGAHPADRILRGLATLRQGTPGKLQMVFELLARLRQGPDPRDRRRGRARLPPAAGGDHRLLHPRGQLARLLPPPAARRAGQRRHQPDRWPWAWWSSSSPRATPSGCAAWVAISATSRDPWRCLLVRILFIPLNIVEELVKPITLALRLFGNIFAGVLMVYLLGLLFQAWAGASVDHRRPVAAGAHRHDQSGSSSTSSSSAASRPSSSCCSPSSTSARRARAPRVTGSAIGGGAHRADRGSGGDADVRLEGPDGSA